MTKKNTKPYTSLINFCSRVEGSAAAAVRRSVVSAGAPRDNNGSADVMRANGKSRVKI